MKWVAYVGPSPARDVPGVGRMEKGKAVEVRSDELAARLLESSVFEEGKAAKAAPAVKPEAGEGE
jgi:hypothetical protein